MREICEHAQVNRSTFYAHFEDIYDMMTKSELAMAEGLGNRFSSTIDAGNFLTPEVALHFFEYVRENREFYTHYLENGEHNTLRYGFEFITEYFVKPVCRKNGLTDPTWIRYYGEFFVSGMLAAVRLWLEEGCVTPPAEMASGMLRILSK